MLERLIAGGYGEMASSTNTPKSSFLSEKVFGRTIRTPLQQTPICQEDAEALFYFLSKKQRKNSPITQT